MSTRVYSVVQSASKVQVDQPIRNALATSLTLTVSSRAYTCNANQMGQKPCSYARIGQTCSVLGNLYIYQGSENEPNQTHMKLRIGLRPCYHYVVFLQYFVLGFQRVSFISKRFSYMFYFKFT